MLTRKEAEAKLHELLKQMQEVLCTMAIRGAMQRKKPPEATGGHESGQSPRKENKWQK